MGILTLLRNAFGRSRKARTADAEGAEQVPSQDPEPTPQTSPTSPTSESTSTPSPAPETAPSPTSTSTPTPTATSTAEPPEVPEPRTSDDHEHELVSAAFNNVTVPKQTRVTEEEQVPAAQEPAAQEAAPQEPAAEERAAEERAPEAPEPVAEEPAPAAEAEPEPEPVAEEPKAEAEPVADQPETEPVAEEPKAEAEPETEEPEPKAEPVAEEPKAEEAEPKAEPVAEEPKAETEEPKPVAEEPKAEEPKAEEPKAEAEPEPKAKPEPVAEERKAEPVAEERKAEPEPVAEVTEPAAADGESAPQGPPAADNESSTGGAGGNNPAEGEAEAEPQPEAAAAAAAADKATATPLTRLKSRAPGLTTAYKAAATTLKKHDLTGTRAKLYLVLDRSASMRPYYKDGSAQALGEQTLALAAHLDPEATVHVVFFSTELDGTGELTLTEHENKIDDLHNGLGRMGRTSYHAAVEAVIAHHEKEAPGTPALVVFQTDGAPDAKTPATQSLTDAAANHPEIFFSFVAFGEHDNKAFDYLRKLKTDNTSFFHAGPTPRELTDAELYEGILTAWRP
ncbi:VWA domain-containing protein [Streptomyces sp. NPDC048751]|uniref:VWA domain-containing protein n=1 Tax=Streptomyces sp. NPDC048751 TaxID=3365591 RepID=UPI0037164B0B